MVHEVVLVLCRAAVDILVVAKLIACARLPLRLFANLSSLEWHLPGPF